MKNNNVEKRKYGLLSLLSLVVGIVIGSGIFFKNQFVYETTNSASLSLFAWIFMAIIVLFMIIGFIEISSSSKYNKEPGTLSNWTSNFIGEKSGKLVSYFFSFIYIPFSIAYLAYLASSQVMTLSPSTTGWNKYGSEFLISIAFLMLIGLMNSFTNKPGKIFQLSGTTIKLIPLLLIILTVVITSFILMGGGTSTIDNGNYSDVWDPNSPINEGLQESTNVIFTTFIAALPAIMFSFDGFIWAASVQTEAKKPNSYKIALFSGIVIICLIYFLYSWSVFVVSPTGGLGINEVIKTLFPKNAYWLEPLFTLFITISVITGLSGFFIISGRNFGSMSEKNYVADLDGKLLARNKVLVPERSTLWILIISLFWFLYAQIMYAFNLIFIPSSDWNSSEKIIVNSFDFISNIITIGAYLVYIVLLVSNIRNKKIKRVETDKIKFSTPITSIVSAIMLFVIAFFIYTVFDPRSQHQVSYFINLTNFFVIFSVLGLIYLYNHLIFKKITKDMFKNKEKYINAFVNLVPWNEIKKDENIMTKYNLEPKTKILRKTMSLSVDKSSWKKCILINC